MGALSTSTCVFFVVAVHVEIIILSHYCYVCGLLFLLWHIYYFIANFMKANDFVIMIYDCEPPDEYLPR